jgi:hypothetical protein
VRRIGFGDIGVITRVHRVGVVPKAFSGEA